MLSYIWQIKQAGENKHHSQKLQQFIDSHFFENILVNLNLNYENTVRITTNQKQTPVNIIKHQHSEITITYIKSIIIIKFNHVGLDDAYVAWLCFIDQREVFAVWRHWVVDVERFNKLKTRELMHHHVCFGSWWERDQYVQVFSSCGKQQRGLTDRYPVFDVVRL